MSESSLTVESLRRHLPFMDQIILTTKGTPFVKKFEYMKIVIESGKKLSPDKVRNIDASITSLLKIIHDKFSDSTSGSVNKNMNSKNNEMEVICISSDDETVNSNLPFHKEHEVVEIKTKEQRRTNNGTKIPNNQEIVIKPERPDVQIIMTTKQIQSNNITPDTDSQKLTIKSENSEVQTIIREVKLNTDYNGNSQQNNNNTTDPNSVIVKEEEPESDIDDYKTVYSGSSERSVINDIPEPTTTQNDDDDDEIIPPSSTKRKRRKISSSSEVSDIERSKETRKRRRILQNSESSDDEKNSQKTSSTSSHKRKRNKSNSSSGSEFYSAESAKSSDRPVKYSSSYEADKNSLEKFQETIMALSTRNNTTDTTEVLNLFINGSGDSERLGLKIFLKRCCERGLLNIDISGPSTSRYNERVLKNFVNLTLNASRQLRNRVVAINEKEQTSGDEESSESSMLDFSDDQDYQCYLNKNENTSRKSRTSRKKQQRKGELDKLKEDIDKSFIKPGLLTLKPREHKKVDYNIDNKASTSDDSDNFVSSIRRDNPESLRKKKYSRRRRISDSSSSKVDQNENNDSDQSDSEIGFKKPLKAKRLEDLDSDRTTPDNLLNKPIETVKNEASDDNRSTPDIDLKNDSRVRTFDDEREIHSDENIDTDCSSGETVRVCSRNMNLSSDEDENEDNPVYHFITVEKIKGWRVNINKLDIIHKPEPYKVYFENGIWKVGKPNSKEKPMDSEMNKSETKLNCMSIKDIKPLADFVNVPLISKDQPTLKRPEVLENEPLSAPANVPLISKDQPTLNRPEVLENVEENKIEDPVPTINIKTTLEDNKLREDPQNTPTDSNLLHEDTKKSVEDNLFYDPILSDSDEDFINMESNAELADLDLTAEQKEIQDKILIDASPKDITMDPISIAMETEMNNITEEKYKIQENNLYDPISSDSEDDGLHIDMKAETSEKEKENDKTNNENGQKDKIIYQHQVKKNDNVNNNTAQNKSTESNSQEIIIIEDSDEIVLEDNIPVESSPGKPKASILADNRNSTLKEKLNKNSRSPNKEESNQSSVTQNKNTVFQKTPQKKHKSPNNTRRKCSPISMLLTETERKVLNLSYISCRGGYQFRCLNSCKFYNLKEEAFKYHILSRHVIDKWAGFCNLCGKSFSKEIRPLIDEYEHMMEYHIKPEHEQRISTKENIDQDDEQDKDEKDSYDSDCIILSQPSESNSNVPEPIAPTKKENEVSSNVPLGQISSNSLQQTENTNKNPDIPKSSHQQKTPLKEQNKTIEAPVPFNINSESNVQQVSQNVKGTSENATPKQILRVKSLPGDKLSGRNDENSKCENKNIAPMPYLDPEMTFSELTELERERNLLRNGLNTQNQPPVKESTSNDINLPMSQLPEGCVPETTPEQEASLLAVLEENISRYTQVNAPPQPPVNLMAVSTLPSDIQPNSIILHKTSNALITYKPTSVPYSGVNSMNSVSTAQAGTNQIYQAATISLSIEQLLARPPKSILPKPSYPVRPTAAVAPSPKNSSDIETGILSTVIMSNSNNAQNFNNTNTVTSNINYMNTNQKGLIQVPSTTNPINTMQNSNLSIQNQTSSTSQETVAKNVTLMSSEVCKTRCMRPWLNIEDLKATSAIDKCFDKNYLMQLYKCMFIACTFATNNVEDFRQHLILHQRAVKNPRNPLFCCCYCTFNTEHVEYLVSHISEKYSLCKYYCSRCFYRTCSQYSAFQHTLIHKNVGSTTIIAMHSIPSILEDQEFKKIKLRELPPLKCINCPQLFHTYDQFRLHVKQCTTGPTILCNKCQKQELISNLEEHLTKCYGVYTYNCCYCTFGSQNFDIMSNHMVHVHMYKIPFYIERCDTSHLSTPLMKKAACIKKFSSTM